MSSQATGWLGIQKLFLQEVINKWQQVLKPNILFSVSEPELQVGLGFSG